MNNGEASGTNSDTLRQDVSKSIRIIPLDRIAQLWSKPVWVIVEREKSVDSDSRPELLGRELGGLQNSSAGWFSSVPEVKKPEITEIDY